MESYMDQGNYSHGHKGIMLQFKKGTDWIFYLVMSIMAEFVNLHLLLHAEYDLKDYGC